MTNEGTVISVQLTNLKVLQNGTDTGLKGNVDNSQLYLPLEVFNKLTGKTMTWDKLSERIVK